MEKKIWFWILIIFLPLLLLPQLSQAIGLEAAIGIWNQDPQGGLGYKGDSLDLDNDLKYTRTAKFFGRAKIDMPLIIPNLYILATPMSYDGTATNIASFTFGDQNFIANTPFSSTLKLDHYDLALYYGVPFLKQATLGMINIDVGLNMRVFDLKAEVSQGDKRESKSFFMAVPMVYVGFQAKPTDSLSLEGEIRAITYNANHYYDLIGRVKYRVFGLVFVSAGYRYEKISIDYNEVKSDIIFSGPLLELGLQF